MNNSTVLRFACALLLVPVGLANGKLVPAQDLPAAGVSPEVLKKLPLNPSQLAELEEAYNSRNYPRAETLLVDESARNPKSADLLIAAANIFFLDSKYLNCAIALKKAEAIKPLSDQDRFVLAMSYIVLNHRDWARPELEKLIHSDPREVKYPYWLGRIEYDLMEYDAAALHLQAALALDPSFLKAYDNLGLTYEGLARYDEAIRNYRQATNLNRLQTHPSPWPPLNLGALLVKLGRLPEAQDCLQESLRYDPHLSKAHYEMGLLCEKQTREQAALHELRLSAQYDPYDPQPHYAMGRVYQNLGDKVSAGAEWRIFEALEKNRNRLTTN
jgi:tetratricopeptide (TPR) repeat protein